MHVAVNGKTGISPECGRGWEGRSNVDKWEAALPATQSVC
jgi:hypothetical protein